VHPEKRAEDQEFADEKDHDAGGDIWHRQVKRVNADEL
jgi:hypothetical protein